MYKVLHYTAVAFTFPIHAIDYLEKYVTSVFKL